MRADSAAFAKACMRDANLAVDECNMSQDDAHAMILSRQYGKVLNALNHLIADIQTESDAGDELCKDLIHQSLLPVFPRNLWEILGYEA